MKDELRAVIYCRVCTQEKVQIVCRMYELTAAGYGSCSVSVILMNEGIMNRNGNQFTDTTYEGLSEIRYLKALL